MPYADPEKQKAYYKEYCARRYQGRKAEAAEYQRRYMQENKEVVVLRRVQARYGLTKDQVKQLSERQNHRCAICGLPAADNRHGNLCVDHDHVTGRLRGLLCYDCNFGLGMMKDSPDRLANAIAYLMEPPLA